MQSDALLMQQHKNNIYNGKHLTFLILTVVSKSSYGSIACLIIWFCCVPSHLWRALYTICWGVFGSISSPVPVFCIEGRSWVSRFHMHTGRSISRKNASDRSSILEWYCGLSRLFSDLTMLLWLERFWCALRTWNLLHWWLHLHIWRCVLHQECFRLI